MDPLSTATSVLTSLSFLLVLGLGLSLLADALRIPRILVLLITGIILGSISINGIPVISFPQSLTFGIAILSLIMIVFTGTSTIKIREVDIATSKALKLLGTFLFFNILFILLLGINLFGLNVFGFTAAMILAIISAGTDAASVFSLLGMTNSEIGNILKIEAVMNTPIVVVLPLIFVRIMQEGYGNFVVAILEKGSEVFKLFVIGIGTGVVLGIILFKILKSMSEAADQQVMLFSGAFLTYIIAEAIGGDGIVGVATLGIMFATYYTRISTVKFSLIAAQALEILVFLLLGISIKIPFNLSFMLRSFTVFIAMFIARFIAVKLALSKKEFTMNEQLVALLLMPKGIATGVTALALVLIEPSLREVSAIILAITIYSLILSSISLLFLRNKIGEKNATPRPSGK
ncbi:cation:proton antiporter [Candidatus Woesearchaeota archaeon]|nr:cation:proton antiporter [Candidatus Woesearchaeota archaeon]